MTNLDYMAESKRLDDLERITLDRDAAARKVSIAAARYQLDQAVSLAMLADSIEALVGHVVGQVPESDTIGKRLDPDEPTWTLATEAEVGSLVVQRLEDGTPDTSSEPATVAQVGASEGDVWIKLKGSDAKLWGKDFVVVDWIDAAGPDDADDELATRIEADRERDGLDDDFTPAPTDGLAALKAGKKAKKGK